MKIVLDTNCLLVALPVSSHYRGVWDAFRQGRFTLCYSTEMLQEYEELLSRFYPQHIVHLTIELLLKLPNTAKSIPYYKWNLVSSDHDDNKFVDCALNAGADYLVTNDRHFNVLKTIDFPRINVVDIETFKHILKL